MSQLDNHPPQKTRRFWRRASIAPVCLCLVAGLHAARVATSNQTPWKGGGFGMFSTVDSEAARFLRVFAVTPDGDLPLVIPTRWEKRAAELRAAPAPETAQELAARLAEMAWQYPDRLVPGELRLEAIAEGKSTADAVAVWEVRVECWRLVFDRAASTLRTEKIVVEDSRDWNFVPQAARQARRPVDSRPPTPDSRP